MTIEFYFGLSLGITLVLVFETAWVVWKMRGWRPPLNQ